MSTPSTVVAEEKHKKEFEFFAKCLKEMEHRHDAAQVLHFQRESRLLIGDPMSFRRDWGVTKEKESSLTLHFLEKNVKNLHNNIEKYKAMIEAAKNSISQHDTSEVSKHFVSLKAFLMMNFQMSEPLVVDTVQTTGEERKKTKEDKSMVLGRFGQRIDVLNKVYSVLQASSEGENSNLNLLDMVRKVSHKEKLLDFSNKVQILGQKVMKLSAEDENAQNKELNQIGVELVKLSDEDLSEMTIMFK